MPTFIPSAVPTASAQTLAQAGTRSRPAGDDNGRSFGAVLERSRAGAKAQDKSESTTTEVTTTPQKAGRGSDRKEEPGSELLTIALFAPQIQAPAAKAAAGATDRSGARTQALRATEEPATQDASLAAASATNTAADSAPDALPAATDASGQQAKAPPVGATGSTAPKAAISNTAAEPPLLPPTQAAATTTETAAQPAVPAVPAATVLPLPGTQPGTRPTNPQAAAGAASASTSPSDAQSKVLPDIRLGAEEAQPAAAEAVIGAPQPNADAASSGAGTPTVLASAAAPMQPALDRTAPATHTAPAQTLAPPVGSPEWGPALGHQMLRMRTDGQQVAELNLNPAGLGPLKITLSVGDNQAQAAFVSSHEAVRKAVEAALPQLRSTLAEQGISLGQTSVGAESRPWAGAGGGFAQQQEQRQPSSSNAAAHPAGGRGEAATAPLPARTPATRNAGVDTFA